MYHNLDFIHKNAISISNSAPDPPTPSSVLVKELSVNYNMGKNNDNNITHILTPHILSSAGIKTHTLKTATLPQQPSKSNISNQQISPPISNNNNIHNYTATLTNSSTHNTKIFSLSQQSSIGKSISNDNPRNTTTLKSLPLSNNNNNNNNHINSHLAIVPRHVVTPTKIITTTTSTATKNNTSIVHKSIASSQIPISNDDSTKTYYDSSSIGTKNSQGQQQQQQEQDIKSTTSPGLDSLPIIAANAGPDQKVKEGKKVILHGDGASGLSSSNTNQLYFLWNQISGKSVKLHHIDTIKAKFKAPHVKKTATKLGFQLTVYDGNGNGSSDIVKIIVKSHKHSHKHRH
jgi:hypothetical protein